MGKKNNEITIRPSAAEYLTYVAATGDNPDSIDVRYEDENIWLTQKLDLKLIMKEQFNLENGLIK